MRTSFVMGLALGICVGFFVGVMFMVIMENVK